MKTKVKISILVLLAFLVFFAIAYFFFWKEAPQRKIYGDEITAKNNGIVRLSNQELNEFNIKIGKVGSGKINVYATLSGEITFNEKRLAHIVPRVSGVVRNVVKDYGDIVLKGDLLAVIESRELADVKAAYLEALKREMLAQIRFKREKRLWERKISSEQDYLDSLQAYEEQRIRLRSSEQKLHALGISEEAVKDLKAGKEHNLTNYEIRSPIYGTVVAKHITLGEKVQADTNIFTVADVSNVWVNLIIYQKDVGLIHIGQKALISSKYNLPQESGIIEYVSEFLSESTRTATARVVLNNVSGLWKPGMFISARISVKVVDVPLMVSANAIQTIDGKQAVFIKEGDGFRVAFVQTGRSDPENIEIISGLSKGQLYVKNNAFTLKAELEKESLGEGHGH